MTFAGRAGYSPKCTIDHDIILKASACKVKDA